MEFYKWLNENSNRYSVEINYRTSLPEVIKGYAKLCLGFVSAALKQHNFHIKQLFTEDPIRIFISTRNWDDGEWIGVLSFDKHTKTFLISKGFYNKPKKTVSIQHTNKVNGTSATEITNEVLSIMRHLEKLPPNLPMLKPLKRKTGPKR